MRTVYFIDRDLGFRIFPNALEDAGLTVVRHDDRFEDQDTPDTVWLREVAERGWVGVSGNKPGSVKQVPLSPRRIPPL